MNGWNAADGCPVIARAGVETCGPAPLEVSSQFIIFNCFLLTLTRPIGLPPHTPVAQKNRGSALTHR